MSRGVAAVDVGTELAAEVTHAGSALRATDPSAVGAFSILRLLGEGGMGTVYLGESAQGRLVAVKVIRSDHARVAEFRERFRRETALAQQVAGLCTAEVLAADPDADLPYLVTEFVPGPTLSAAVTAGGPLSPADLERLAVGVAAALTAIHVAGIAHLDLKPSNVLLGPAGPRVIDFGIANAVGATTVISQDAARIGTPGYMAPEQARDDQVGSAADVFAWAGVMAFAASGRPPFGDGAPHALLYRVVHEEPDLSGVPAGMVDLVRRAFSKDPDARPAAGELLLGLLGGSTDDAEPALARALDGWRRPTPPPTDATGAGDAAEVTGATDAAEVTDAGDASEAVDPSGAADASEASEVAPARGAAVLLGLVPPDSAVDAAGPPADRAAADRAAADRAAADRAATDRAATDRAAADHAPGDMPDAAPPPAGADGDGRGAAGAAAATDADVTADGSVGSATDERTDEQTGPSADEASTAGAASTVAAVAAVAAVTAVDVAAAVGNGEATPAPLSSAPPAARPAPGPDLPTLETRSGDQTGIDLLDAYLTQPSAPRSRQVRRHAQVTGRPGRRRRAVVLVSAAAVVALVVLAVSTGLGGADGPSLASTSTVAETSRPPAVVATHQDRAGSAATAGAGDVATGGGLADPSRSATGGGSVAGGPTAIATGPVARGSLPAAASSVAPSPPRGVPASAAVPAAGVPGVRVVPASGAVLVTVTAPGFGGPVTSYTVTAAPGGTRTIARPGTVSLPVGGCPRVAVAARAGGAGGFSAWSMPVQVLGCIPPGAPRAVTSVPVRSWFGGSGDLLVSWRSPADTGGGPGAAVGYVVTVLTSDGDDRLRQYVYAVSTNSYRLGLPSGRDAYVKITVAARNSAGTGPAVVGYTTDARADRPRTRR